MAVTSAFVVKRTFLELAEFASEPPRARFSTDGALGMLKLGDVDHGSFFTDCSSLADSEVSLSRWADESEDEPNERTTVMLRDLDTSMDREELLRVLNASRFRGGFDFIYVPCGFHTREPQGMAFINFTNHRDAHQFQLQPPASLGADVRTLWSDKEQGRSENVGRYRNSPVMHPSLPEHVRPSLVELDALVALPEPTQPIKAPKVTKIKRSL